ncbi:DUF4238 domain-containing protein [Pantoea agglomerans]|uniref:DUF4238 domain-containing protein n=2 Tax=Enterobacter agglomerans TaxID=549 RepID=UPI003209771D
MDYSDLKIQNKKKQHYVPQFYLNSWLGNFNKELWVRNSKKKEPIPYRQCDTTDLCEEIYFYKVEIDDVVFDMLNYKYANDIVCDEIVKRILNKIHMLKLADDVIRKKQFVTNTDKIANSFAEDLLKVANKNFLENEYSIMEKIVSHEINVLTKSQSSHIVMPISEKVHPCLIAFFSFQYFRTEKTINMLRENITSMVLQRDGEDITLTDKQTDSVLKCTLYIESFKLARTLEKENYHITVLKNHTKLNLITSDSPAILFYDQGIGIMPLAPKLLMKLEKKSYSSANKKMLIDSIVNSDVIGSYNSAIAQASHSILIAKKKSELKAINKNL